MDPSNDSKLWTLNSSKKILGSSDGGITWLDATLGLPNNITSINSLNITPLGKVLVFSDLGIICGIPILTAIVNEKQQNINTFQLSQNYPNPWNPSTTIKYSIAKEGNVKLTVYNAIGSKVATIVNEYKPAGNYSVQFSGNNLASGIYFYRLESGNYSDAKKFILMK